MGRKCLNVRNEVYKAFVPLATRWKGARKKLQVLLCISISGGILLTLNAQYNTHCGDYGSLGFGERHRCQPALPFCSQTNPQFLLYSLSPANHKMHTSQARRILAKCTLL